MANIIAEIQTLTDQKQLEEIINAAQNRLQNLRQPRTIHLVLHRNHWYGVEERDGKKMATPLGRRLTPAEVLANARNTGPTALDFEISKEEADRRHLAEREAIGWVEEDTPAGVNHRYYIVPDYEQARAEWRVWRGLAQDPIAMAYGIGVEGMGRLCRLVEGGCEVVYPGL
jgi:hypothetical protein